MVAVELPYDGFTTYEDRGFHCRSNPTHIVRCVDAIRKRWQRETKHDIRENNVVRLTQVRRRATVIK